MKNPMILDENMPVVLGNCIRVENVEKSLGEEKNPEEADVFVCVQVESENGNDEYPILMTQQELERLPRVDFMDMSEMVAGRAYPKFIKDKNYYCVKLLAYDGETFVGAFDIGYWKDCFIRAMSHPRSCTKKKFITDVLD